MGAQGSSDSAAGTSRRRILIVPLGIVLGAIAGCGGSGSDTARSSPRARLEVFATGTTATPIDFSIVADDGTKPGKPAPQKVSPAAGIVIRGTGSQLEKGLGDIHLRVSSGS